MARSTARHSEGSYGAIDMTGILAGEQPPDETIRWLSHAGITTRRVRDTALVLDVLADRADDTGTWRDALAGERRLRVGVADNVTVDGDVSSAFGKTVDTIRSLGHEVNHAAAPLWDFRTGIAHIERDRRAIADRAFKHIDVLVLPTTVTATLAVKDAIKNPQALSPELTMFANYYGLPAVSVPCGFDRRGLPVGLQIVAKPSDDRVVLQLAYQFEQAAGFHTRPPIE